MPTQKKKTIKVS